jgi:hypothetical protein
MKIIIGIIIGVIIALSIPQTYAKYRDERFSWVEEDAEDMRIFWDEHEKTNCYVFYGYNKGGIDCVRSINYEK